jgi:CheY-like chemotaxis protein
MALEKILQHTPDLIILDLLMPELDGPSLLAILRSYLRLRDLPVIVLTALHEGPVFDRMRNFKVKTIFLKGKTTLNEIAQAVEQTLKPSA